MIMHESEMRQNEMYRVMKKNMALRRIEVYLWPVFSTVIALPGLLNLFSKKIKLEDLLLNSQQYSNFLTVIFLLIFPILFNLIFGYLPLEMVRARRFKKEYKVKGIQSGVQTKLITDKEHHPMYQLSIESNEIANKIYSRAGVYLFIGCLIAFGGLAIFYSPSSTNINVSNNTSVINEIVAYLPKFGALLFIELVAFFFLKQYKITMEEFRYYERIKRRRQDNYTILEIIEKNASNQEALNKILEYCKFEDNISKISKEETTELIELHKMNDDLDLLDKFIDLAKNLKKS